MKRNFLLTGAAFALAGSMSLAWLAHDGMAQSNPDDDDGGDDDGDDDDDDDVPDPDDPETAPPDGGDEPPDDPGGNDGGGDDGGGDDGGGDDGGAGGGSDDGGGGAGDDDDGGSGDEGGGTGGAGGGDDGEGETDDDDDASPATSVGATAGGDDDDDDDDDDEGPASGNTGASNNDDDDDDAPSGGGGGDDGDDNSPASGGNDDVLEIIGGGDETESQRIQQDERDGIDTDREGFRYRKREFVALDLDASDLAALRSKGFELVRSEKLAALAGTMFLVRGPAGRNDSELLDEVEDLADPGALSLNHLFDSSSARVRKQKKLPPITRVACGCRIGLIDTGVAAKLPMFKHVQIDQRAFNGTAVAPRLHGTAVAHLFAGTAAKKGTRTRIHVADIFAGPRATAGSTYALVKALDWMAAQGVPVVNVSLAGPGNSVIAAAVDRLTKKGHIVVAAAGNDGPAAPPVFPGAYGGVVAVTAVDDRQQVYRYANRGTYVDFAAAGVNIPSMDPAGLRAVATGTSFAAPIVAAQIAVRMTRPDVAAAKAAVGAVEKAARDLGAPGRDPTFGQGLVEDVR